MTPGAGRHPWHTAGVRPVSIVVAALALLVTLTAAEVAVGTAPAQAAEFKSCAPVRGIFEGSRYEGDLYRIRAKGTSCRAARHVARQGTRRAVADVPDSSGRVVVRYRRWTIVDDLTGDVDRFVARAASGKRARWLFGDI